MTRAAAGRSSISVRLPSRYGQLLPPSESSVATRPLCHTIRASVDLTRTVGLSYAASLLIMMDEGASREAARLAPCSRRVLFSCCLGET
jgi:hypothetical protein